MVPPWLDAPPQAGSPLPRRTAVLRSPPADARSAIVVTPLEKPVRRAVTVDGQEYVVTISPEGLRIVPKGKRKGYDVPWQDVLAGEITLRAQLNRSLATPRQPSSSGGQRSK